jgi:hypothetical protein
VTAARRASLRELRGNPAFTALARSTAATALGNGAFGAISFLYYTRSEGLGAGAAATALTAFGLIAIVASLPAGRWLENANPATANAVLLAAQAAAAAGLALARPVVPLLALIGVTGLASKVKLAARSALISKSFQGRDRTAARAWIRTCSNVGIGAGSALAAVAISLDSAASYRVTLMLVAALYLAGAWPLWRARRAGTPPPPPATSSARPGASACRPRLAILDGRYVLVATVSGLMGMHYFFIEVGLPVWLTARPGRALWVVSAALAVNTAVVALGQVRLSRPINSVRAACRATAAAGGCFLLATLVIAGLGGLGRVAGALAVLAAVAVYSVGEILHASASWELSFELAPAAQASEYQSVFTSGLALGAVIAPVVITSLLLRFGDQGWVLLGAMMAVLGSAHLAFAAFPSQGAGSNGPGPSRLPAVAATLETVEDQVDGEVKAIVAGS